MAAENKTQPTLVPVQDFLATVEHPTRRADADTLMEMMKRVTGEEPVMWGPSIIGFGSYHYKYDSGREGDAAALGFSPRKSSLSLYGLTYFPGAEDLLAKLGKHKKAVACLYINKLADVDLAVLEEMMSRGYQHTMTAIDKPCR